MDINSGVRRCKNKTSRNHMESQLGTRYTALLDLPYYASVSMCVIDPMHNLYLGTAKRIFKLWVERELLGKREMEIIQERIDKMQGTSDLGRLPGNISSNYGGFTAAQWKNWIHFSSLYALEGVFLNEHLHC